MWKIMPHDAKASLEYTFESAAQPVKSVDVGQIRHDFGPREMRRNLSTLPSLFTACDIREWSWGTDHTEAKGKGEKEAPIKDESGSFPPFLFFSV